MSAMWSVARGTSSGVSIPKVARSSWNERMCGSVKPRRS